jgi:transmembrane protein 17
LNEHVSSIKVPELTGFWLLTLIIELPICLFTLIAIWLLKYPTPIQTAMEIIHTIFVFVEAIFGFVALKTLARYQGMRWRLFRKFTQVFQDFPTLKSIKISL